MIKVGITHGDINGVGYEIILKTFAEDRMMELCTPVIYGSLKIALSYQKVLGFEPLGFKVIQKAEDAAEGKLNIINCMPAELTATPGESTADGGKAAFKALEAAVADLKRGAIDTLVTAPINKHNIQCEGFRFPGHTEYLAHGADERRLARSVGDRPCTGDGNQRQPHTGGDCAQTRTF